MTLQEIRNILFNFEKEDITKEELVKYIRKYCEINNIEEVDYNIFNFMASLEPYIGFIDLDIIKNSLRSSREKTLPWLISDYATIVKLTRNLFYDQMRELVSVLIRYCNDFELLKVYKFYTPYLTDEVKSFILSRNKLQNICASKSSLKDKKECKRLIEENRDACGLVYYHRMNNTVDKLIDVKKLYSMSNDKAEFIELVTKLYQNINMEDPYIETTGCVRLLIE